jgi:peptide/nickel transport system permease protein
MNASAFATKRSFPASLVIGAGLTVIFLVAALVSFVWTPFDPASFNVPERLQAPSLGHLFGTDHFGRDIFSNVLAGARTSIAVAIVAVGLGAMVGIPLGLIAAAAGGVVDEWLMRASDIVFAFPALLLAILMTAALGPGVLNAVLAIGIFNIPVFARFTRGSARALWKREFILAAGASGKNKAEISFEHILPNITDLLIVQGTIQFSIGVLAEAGLSYVGLGAAPPAASWGRMLAESQSIATIAPWTAIFPGLAIVLCVLGLNLLGDGLRDVFDPKRAR